ncbi:MAG TPA: xylulokinase [Terriglobales bacterium]|nr:xylulokinase [Terriglobales bacterium]
MKFLGIDVGTGGTRAILIESSGAVIGSAAHEHKAFASPHTGWAEHDPHDWWNACKKAIRQVIATTGIAAEEISCIGLTGQMHGAVLLDESGQVLRPALIWCDQRTQEQCDWLTSQVGKDRLIELTCNPALTNFTLTKLLWVRQNEPHLWKRFHSFLLPKDYVRMRLSGVRAIDVAEASGTLLLDVANRCWSKEMLAATGLDENCLPKLYESPDVVGCVTAEGAAETGLRIGTPIIAGAGDQAAGAVGMGIVRPGAVSATIGTSGVVFAACNRPALDPKGRIHTFCHAVPGRWHVMGVTQAAGLSLRWFRDTFGAGADDGRDPYERLCAEAAQVPPGADGVLWTPYLMGERTPHCDSQARASLIGLAANHGRGHIIRAILEGVAFSLRDTLTILEEMKVPAQEIRLGGGGARSPLWSQIQADVYGQSVSTLQAEEGAAYGAAILAGVGAGAWPSVEAACDSAVRVASQVAPDTNNVAVMQRQYAAYRRVYAAAKSIWADAASAKSCDS